MSPKPNVLAVVLLALLTMGQQKCSTCATGERFDGYVCVCKPGHVKDDDGRGCHVPDAPPPTTTTTLAPIPTPTTTTTTLPPTPAPGCTLPPMPECGSVGHVDPEAGIYGCCVTDKSGPLPSSAPFDEIVDQEQTAIERGRPELFDRDGRVDEDAYVNELVRRLRARGLCAVRGGPGDEVGLKASNGESFQFDIHLGNGRPRRSGYTAYCRPARF